MSKSKLNADEGEYMEAAAEIVEAGKELMNAPATGLAGLGGADTMREKLKEHTEIRNVIMDYIEDNMIKDVDFGWTDERSLDKHTLKKPGAEKVCRLFDTHPRWIRDYDTWEMAGKPPGTLFYICQIVSNKTGEVIGEGRGAAQIGAKSRDANKAVKNAEKCALVDAALYTFMLSEKFTQDDGGQKTTTLTEWKRELISDVETARTGIKSNVTTHMFIQGAIKAVLKSSRIDTLAQYKEVRKAIFEQKRFNLETGEEI